MPDKGTGEESDADRGKRFITELPHAAVQSVHVLRPTGKNAYGHATGEDFSVGSEIGANIEKRLTAAGMNAEAGI